MKVSEQATIELKKALENFDDENAGIQIITTQGCCGTSIQMEIAKHPKENQTVINIDGIDFFIDNQLLDSLESVSIEYGWRGFRLEGLPKKTGGCC